MAKHSLHLSFYSSHHTMSLWLVRRFFPIILPSNNFFLCCFSSFVVVVVSKFNFKVSFYGQSLLANNGICGWCMWWHIMEDWSCLKQYITMKRYSISQCDFEKVATRTLILEWIVAEDNERYQGISGTNTRAKHKSTLSMHEMYLDVARCHQSTWFGFKDFSTSWYGCSLKDIWLSF